jgi:hypothetical protein
MREDMRRMQERMNRGRDEGGGFDRSRFFGRGGDRGGDGDRGGRD